MGTETTKEMGMSTDDSKHYYCDEGTDEDPTPVHRCNQNEPTNHPTPVILDDAALEEIEARANAATPGPWVIVESALPDDWGVTEGKLGTERKGLFRRKPRHQSIAQMLWEEDAPFVAHARTDIPALCQTVRAAWAKLDFEYRAPAGLSSLLDFSYKQRDELQSENTALREQLAQAQTDLDEQAYIIKTHGDTIVKQANAATQMRDQCVKKVRAMAAEYHKKAQETRDYERGASLGMTASAFDEAVTALESLTLEAAANSVKDSEGEGVEDE